MIRTQREYEGQLRQVEEYKSVVAEQRRKLEESGLLPEQVERGLEPFLSFTAQVEDEVNLYERVLERDFSPICDFTNIGQLLIALRIANKISQKELALRLEVHESQVSRDERNEYYGVTIGRATEIIEAMNERVSVHVEGRSPHRSESASSLRGSFNQTGQKHQPRVSLAEQAIEVTFSKTNKRSVYNT